MRSTGMEQLGKGLPFFMFRKYRSRQTGYSLIELIVTASIAVILGSLALPAFANIIRSQQSLTAIQTLMTAYQQARTSAIMLNKPVTFCARKTSRSCGSDWSQGALVFTDNNSSNTIEEDERLFIDLPPFPSGSNLSISTFGNRKYLRFAPNGLLENYSAGNIIFCPPGGKDTDARNLIFTRAGRPRLGTDKNGDGIREDAEGQPLHCP